MREGFPLLLLIGRKSTHLEGALGERKENLDNGVLFNELFCEIFALFQQRVAIALFITLKEDGMLFQRESSAFAKSAYEAT